MNLVVTNGTIVLDSGHLAASMVVTGDRVAALVDPATFDPTAYPTHHCIDAQGMLIIPGVIDAHTHFQLPFCGTVTADTFASGTAAAAMGGVTTIIDFANPPTGGSILIPVLDRLEQMDGACAIDYTLHGSACGLNATSLNEFQQITEMGIKSLKLFMNYSKVGRMCTDAEMYQYLLMASDLDAVISVHAENDTIIEFLRADYVARSLTGVYYHGVTRPAFTEGEAIARACLLALNANAKLHIVHMTTGDGVEEVTRARELGARVTCETCPQYLLFDEQVFETDNGYLYATCPPLRGTEHVDRLWYGLRLGIINLIATDHCVFTRKQKDAWNGDFTRIPYGLPGVETTLPLLYTYGVGTGRISAQRMVELLSANPAKVFGLYPRKGTLLPGSDADFVILDPDFQAAIDYQTLATPCDWSPYQGLDTDCQVRDVYVRGQAVVQAGKYVGTEGAGKFIRR